MRQIGGRKDFEINKSFSLVLEGPIFFGKETKLQFGSLLIFSQDKVLKNVEASSKTRISKAKFSFYLPQ